MKHKDCVVRICEGLAALPTLTYGGKCKMLNVLFLNFGYSPMLIHFCGELRGFYYHMKPNMRVIIIKIPPRKIFFSSFMQLMEFKLSS